jgi:hypothetical protein
MDFYKTFDYQIFDKMRDLIVMIQLKIQSCLGEELNRIKDLMLEDEMQKEERANKQDMISVMNNKHLIEDLLVEIAQFESDLKSLSQKYRNEINLLENYNFFTSNFQFNYEMRIIRTVSPTDVA